MLWGTLCALGDVVLWGTLFKNFKLLNDKSLYGGGKDFIIG